MRLGTKAKPPASADVTETLSDLMYRNRLNVMRRGDVNVPLTRTTEPVKLPVRRRNRSRPIFFVVAGVLVVIGSMVFWQQTVVPWWTGLQNQWNYGSAHITQLDADVGHGGMSHFIAEYSKGEIVIIEISYANPTNNHIYTLNGMLSSEAKPVILLSTAKDVHSGRIDLVIDVQGSGFQTVLYNTGAAFSEKEP